MITYLVYDNSFEGFLTAVFEIYDRKIVKPVICRSESEIPLLFAEKLIVFTDAEKSERVNTKIISLAGTDKSILLWKAWLSELPHCENVIFSVIKYLLAAKKDIFSDYSDPFVLKLHQILKKVGREKHRMEAFVRFELTKDNIYFARIEPDFNVLPLLITHFQNRYADQKWLIFDVKRNYGLYYELHNSYFITLDNFAADEKMMDEEEGKYRLLWQQYFKSVNIPARKNTELHVKHLPKRYWKYLTEKRF